MIDYETGGGSPLPPQSPEEILHPETYGVGETWPVDTFEREVDDLFRLFDKFMPEEGEWNQRRAIIARIKSHNPGLNGNLYDENRAFFDPHFCLVRLEYLSKYNEKMQAEFHKFKVEVPLQTGELFVQTRRQIVLASAETEADLHNQPVYVFHEPNYLDSKQRLPRRIEEGKLSRNYSEGAGEMTCFYGSMRIINTFSDLEKMNILLNKAYVGLVR